MWIYIFLVSGIARWNLNFGFDAVAVAAGTQSVTEIGIFSVSSSLLGFALCALRARFFPITFDVAIKTFSRALCVPFDSDEVHTAYLVFYVCCFHIKCGFPRQRRRRWWWWCVVVVLLLLPLLLAVVPLSASCYLFVLVFLLRKLNSHSHSDWLRSLTAIPIFPLFRSVL